MMKYSIRPIQQKDNPSMAQVIRKVMTDLGAVGNGFSIEDAEVDKMYETYHHQDRAAFYVVVDENDRVVGGGGFADLEGSSQNICELRKMYFLPEARGKGLGKQLLDIIVSEAKKANYRNIYLETLKSMEAANELYTRVGFRKITGPMGSTGHDACDRYMILDLN